MGLSGPVAGAVTIIVVEDGEKSVRLTLEQVDAVTDGLPNFGR